jgi:hypothetical protein
LSQSSWLHKKGKCEPGENTGTAYSDVNIFGPQNYGGLRQQVAFLGILAHFYGVLAIAALKHGSSPVFLLARKLTMNENGTDNLVICHTQTIEPVIRTFQSG